MICLQWTLIKYYQMSCWGFSGGCVGCVLNTLRKMGFIKDFYWVTDMCGRDIWMLCSAKKHDGWGVSFHDLFLTSCCVRAPWLCNLPCGLKQCRLVFFLFLYLSLHPFPDSWFVTVLSWCVCFSPNLLLTLFLVGRAFHGQWRVTWPKAGLTCHFLPEQMAFVCDPFHTLEDREGQGGVRRVAGRQGGLLRATGTWRVV